MTKRTQKRLKKAGWKVGTVQDLFGLTGKQAKKVEKRAKEKVAKYQVKVLKEMVRRLSF